MKKCTTYDNNIFRSKWTKNTMHNGRRNNIFDTKWIAWWSKMIWKKHEMNYANDDESNTNYGIEWIENMKWLSCICYCISSVSYSQTDQREEESDDIIEWIWMSVSYQYFIWLIWYDATFIFWMYWILNTIQIDLSSMMISSLLSFLTLWWIFRWFWWWRSIRWFLLVWVFLSWLKHSEKDSIEC